MPGTAVDDANKERERLRERVEETALAVVFIAVLCFLPWLVVLYVIANRHRWFAPSLPNFDGSGLLWAVVVLAVLAFLLLLYEIIFRFFALKIVDYRPRGDLDLADNEKLVKGFPREKDSEAARKAAETLFGNIKGALDQLTVKDGALKGQLKLDAKTPDDVIKGIGSEGGLGELDRAGLFDRLTHAVDHMQSRIDGEFSAIASRVGWVLTSQAFLLGAFASIVNAERIAPVTQFWLAVGVAFTGAVISFVLSLASNFGHALVERLKKARDDLEALLHEHFGIRRCGVPLGAAVHILGHSATRYVPGFLYVAWVTLTLAALSNLFVGEAAPRTVLQGPVRLSHGWVKYPEASPTFRPEAYEYPEGEEKRAGKKAEEKDDCPTSADAERWVSEVVAAWRLRHEAGPHDVLVLVGGADRTRLGVDLQRQIDSNMALARQRAETVRKLLEKATINDAPLDQISPERVLITVTGPRIGHRDQKASGGIRHCKDKKLNEDRTVEVWLPGLLPKPNK